MIEKTKQKFHTLSGLLGILCIGTGIVFYAIWGFSPQLLWFWLIGLCLVSFWAFKMQPAKTKFRPKKKDILMILGLILAFAPLYLYKVHDVPRQMNTDEIMIMTMARDLAESPEVDLFGPSNYFGFPNFIFWLFGKLGLMLGGVTLAHMRTVHALSGVLIIVASFCLFRQLLSRPAALLATTVFGVNHSLFFISRMAMRDNTALLLEILALLLLVRGWRTKSFGWSLLGGVAAGLTFYTYYPSRITFVIWLAFLGLQSANQKFRNWRLTIQLGFMAVLGFTVMVVPLFISTGMRAQTSGHTNETLLLSASGREMQQHWINAPDERSGVITNIRQGLLTFNQAYPDNGNIYPHPGYGFVDGLTGLLIWVGLAIVVISAIKKRQLSDRDLLMITGFLVIWLVLAFVINKAPNYTRLLVILPFLGYLVARAVEAFVEFITKHLKHRNKSMINGVVIVAAISLIALNNILIAADFILVGNIYGGAVGDSLRFVEQHADENIDWYFAPSSQTSYFDWGSEVEWNQWLSFAKGEHQVLTIIPVNSFEADMGFSQIGRGGYLLTDESLWRGVRPTFLETHIIESEENLTPDGRLVAIRFH